MEPDALRIIEGELRDRGISEAQIDAHAAARAPVVLRLADGTARSCSICRRPAVAEGWGWHRLWGLVPVFPCYYLYCTQHEPRASASRRGFSAKNGDVCAEGDSLNARAPGEGR
jgi:hypothetical protein